MCATTAQTGGGAWSEEEGHHGYNSRAQNDIIIGRNRPRSVPSSVVNNILSARPSRMRHNYYVDDGRGAPGSCGFYSAAAARMRIISYGYFFFSRKTKRDTTTIMKIKKYLVRAAAARCLGRRGRNRSSGG